MNEHLDGRINWLPDEELSFEEWATIFAQTWKVHQVMPWILGDILRYGETMFGEDYASVIPETAAAESLRVYLWVASKIDPSRRIPELSWTHHRYVAALPPDEQDSWLKLALLQNWSSADLRDAIAEARRMPEPDVDPGSSQGDEAGARPMIGKIPEALRYVLRDYLDSDDVEEIVQRVMLELEGDLVVLE